MRPKLVFTGPTLSHAEGGQEIDAIFLPPAVQGSIVAAVQYFDPAAILVIDGGFQTEPAVRHKEILWAIARGVPVAGAASMGALRAAELRPFMFGVGLVYRWYRRFAFAPDDAVAVLHGPQELDFAPVTQALVDLLVTFRAACRQHLISQDLAQRLAIAAKRLNFRDRTLGSVCQAALPDEDKGACEILERRLAAAFVHAKKRDALHAIRLLREGAFATAPELAHLPVTAAFARDLELVGLTI